MGMFGSFFKGLQKVDPETGLSWADRINGMAGVVNEDPNAYARLQQIGASRKAMTAQQDLVNQLFNQRAPAAPMQVESGFGGIEGLSIPQVGERVAPSLNDPQTQQALFKAQAGGANIAPIVDMLQATNPQRKFFSTTDGIVSVGPDGKAEVIYADKPPSPSAPAGYRWNGDALEYIPGGPADPRTVGNMAGVRRDVVVNKPIPRKSNGRSGSSGGAKLPSGFILD